GLGRRVCRSQRAAARQQDHAHALLGGSSVLGGSETSVRSARPTVDPADSPQRVRRACIAGPRRVTLPRMGRSYTLGLAIGSLWLIVAAVGCSVTVLVLMDMQAATIVAAAVLTVAVVVAAAAGFV